VVKESPRMNCAIVRFVSGHPNPGWYLKLPEDINGIIRLTVESAAISKLPGPVGNNPAGRKLRQVNLSEYFINPSWRPP
jgi:hypothetical protein